MVDFDNIFNFNIYHLVVYVKRRGDGNINVDNVNYGIGYMLFGYYQLQTQP